MYRLEKIIISVLILTALTTNFYLTIMNFGLIKHFGWSPPPSYFGDLLLLCNMLGTGAILPGGLREFNQQLVDAIIFNFGSHPTIDQNLKPALLNANYRFISATSNIGPTLWLLIILTKIALVVKLYLTQRQIKFSGGKYISLPMIINFELSS